MIISINAAQKHLVGFFNKFATAIQNFTLQVINSYNHPYLASYNPNADNILVIKFDTVDNLFENATRAGKFYINSNEFILNFTLFFISFITDSKPDASSRMFAIYELFSEFLYDNNNYKVSLAPTNNDTAIAKYRYTTNITYYIYPTSGMQNNGLLTLDSRNSGTAYCANNAFKSSIKVEEILEK